MNCSRSSHGKDDLELHHRSSYIFFAAVLPMWLLKQPRDYMTTFMFIGMIAGAAVGLLVAHPSMNLPVFTELPQREAGRPVPHPVRHGGLRRCLRLPQPGLQRHLLQDRSDNEKDMLKVGYGAMVLESLLAVLALCVAGAAAAADGTPAAGTPFQIFSRGVAGFFEMFGVPVSMRADRIHDDVRFRPGADQPGRRCENRAV